jgi:hypothetical protein
MKKSASSWGRTKISISDKQVEDVLASVGSSLERCVKIFRLLQQEESGSGKAVLYQSDLETEIAYQLVLGSSRDALERWGKRKDPLSLEQEKWKFLEEAAVSYLGALLIDQIYSADKIF